MRVFLFCLTLFCATPAFAVDRPNVLWITVEDMSPTMGCYGDSYAKTPNLDALAKESVLYEKAFATAPVCSPSRSCLINGVYAQSQGTHNMRSAFPIPKEFSGFPGLLRKAGYYTSNNVKTDYNSGNFQEIIDNSWDESKNGAFWRQRSEGKPFFSVINIMTTHQSRTMVWPYERFVKEIQVQLKPEHINAPETVPLPAYYPDTPAVRRTVARFYDCVRVMDQQVGRILGLLKADGLEENTIVFFYSDHGSGMPRHKRAILDSGMRVPLLIRTPQRYRDALRAQAPGSRVSRLVSFVDFAPTVLDICGISIPKFVQGRSFLGPNNSDERRYVYGHRDRVDEVYDMVRSVRDARYLYVRNYMPHFSYHQASAWPDQGEIRAEFDSSHLSTAAQLQYAGERRPAEELYDCDADPTNLKNLVDSREHRAVLERLRSALRSQTLKIRDLGFLPESTASAIAKEQTLWSYARSRESYPSREVLDTAELVGRGTESAILEKFTAKDPDVRYWAAVGLNARESISSRAADVLLVLLRDSTIAVRVEAAYALA
ncbi:MAG: sulfatase-like hydrolase/transferase, partial [Planctomycetota bacterium]